MHLPLTHPTRLAVTLGTHTIPWAAKGVGYEGSTLGIIAMQRYLGLVLGQSVSVELQICSLDEPSLYKA